MLTSIQKHLGHSRVCKQNISKETLTLLKELSDSAKKETKSKNEKKRYQEKKPQILQQRKSHYKANAAKEFV